MSQHLTLRQFGTSVLHELGIKPNKQNVRAMVGWARAEGGHFHNDAEYNPLNTTLPMPGAGNTGTQGNIKVYKDWHQGVKATVETLRNGNYGGILHALAHGSAEDVANAIGSSPWGTSGGLISSVIRSTPLTRPAHHVIGAHGPSAGKYSLTARGGEVEKGRAPSITPGGTTVDKRSALLAALLDPRKKMGLLARFNDAVSSGAYTVTTPPKVNAGKGDRFAAGDKLTVTAGSGDAQAADSFKQAMRLAREGHAPTGLRHLKGVVDFEGHKVAAWIAVMLEYGRKHGWTGGVNSGYRSDAEQTRIYNSGVRPAAVPRSLGGSGSNHEMKAYPGGAVDVSNAAQLSQILSQSPYAHVLVWAGSKDPVHFSHPHNGSY